MRTSMHTMGRLSGRQICGVVLITLIAAAVAGCDPSARTGWLGLNTQLAEAALRTPDPAHAGPPDASLALLDELKPPKVRDTAMNWAVIQPQAGGPCDFAFSDRLVLATQSRRADLLAVFRGVPAWAAGDPNARATDIRVPARDHAPAFADFVRRFVERYDDDGRADMPRLAAPVRAYQFLYEMEEIPPGEYAWWLKVFYDSVKSADPQATVVLGGLRSPGLKLVDEPLGDYPTYFERLLADPELAGPAYPCFDVAAFHSFPARHPGRPAFDEPVAYMRQVMARHNLSLPIWLTAYGAGSNPEELNRQVDNLVKWTVKAPTIGIQRAYLYCLSDSGDAGHGSVQNCGLIREGPDGQIFRKPAFHAFQKLLTEIQDRPDVSFRGDGMYVLSGTGSPRYVIWREDSYQTGSPLMNGWWSVETPTGPKTVRQGSEITLTASPVLMERTTSPFIQ